MSDSYKTPKYAVVAGRDPRIPRSRASTFCTAAGVLGAGLSLFGAAAERSVLFYNVCAILTIKIKNN